MAEFEIERRLRRLIARYEAASAGAALARSECVSLAEANAASTPALTAARARLKQLERRRDSIRQALETLEDHSAA